MDLYPTLLRLVGGAPVSGAGRDLSADLLAGRNNAAVGSLCADERLDQRRLRAVMVGQRKLIVDEKTQREMFFDLRKDPGEKAPIADIPADLRERLAECRRAGVRSSAASVRSARPLSEGERESLKMLGYGEPEE